MSDDVDLEALFDEISAQNHTAAVPATAAPVSAAAQEDPLEALFDEISAQTKTGAASATVVVQEVQEYKTDVRTSGRHRALAA